MKSSVNTTDIATSIYVIFVSIDPFYQYVEYNKNALSSFAFKIFTVNDTMSWKTNTNSVISNRL